MDEKRCEFCETPLSPNGELDDNGQPYCNCLEAQLKRIEERDKGVCPEDSVHGAEVLR